jgi:predicted DNA-binding transcriptional regulator YafY
MPRGSQLIRHWRILRLLEGSKYGMRAVDIRKELENEVAERTVFRDLRHLQSAGFPLMESDEGRWTVLKGAEGGFCVPVDPTELLALFISQELLAPIRSTEIAGALEQVRKKLSATLTPIGRQFAQQFAEARVATFTAPGDYGDRGEVVRCIEEAIVEEESLQMVYKSPNGKQSSRKVDPYTLWYADGRLYLIGWCHLRREFRTFLVDRVRSIDRLNDTFDRNPEFSPRDYVSSGFGVWRGQPYRVQLLFRPEVSHLTEERRFHHTQKVQKQPDGSALLTMQISGLPRLAAWIAGFGGRVTVRSPRELADLVRELHWEGLQASGLKGPVRATTPSLSSGSERNGKVGGPN